MDSRDLFDPHSVCLPNRSANTLGRPHRLLCLIPILAFWCGLQPRGADAEIRDVVLQPTGINRYSARVTFTASQSSFFLVDTGAAYSVVPATLMSELRASGEADFRGHDTVRAADGRVFSLEKFLVRTMTVAGCELNDELVYASPARHGILGMKTLTRLSPITLDIEAQTLSLNCLAQ